MLYNSMCLLLGLIMTTWSSYEDDQMHSFLLNSHKMHSWWNIGKECQWHAECATCKLHQRVTCSELARVVCDMWDYFCVGIKCCHGKNVEWLKNIFFTIYQRNSRGQSEHFFPVIFRAWGKVWELSLHQHSWPVSPENVFCICSGDPWILHSATTHFTLQSIFMKAVNETNVFVISLADKIAE